MVGKSGLKIGLCPVISDSSSCQWMTILAYKEPNNNPQLHCCLFMCQSWRSKSFRMALKWAPLQCAILGWHHFITVPAFPSYFFIVVLFSIQNTSLCKSLTYKKQQVGWSPAQLGPALPLRVVKAHLQSTHWGGKQQYLRGLTQIMWAAPSLLSLAVKNGCCRSLQ